MAITHEVHVLTANSNNPASRDVSREVSSKLLHILRMCVQIIKVSLLLIKENVAQGTALPSAQPCLACDGFHHLGRVGRGVLRIFGLSCSCHGVTETKFMDTQ